MAYTFSNLQDETKDYVARILQAGGKIDAATITAIDKFVTWGKRDGWYALLNYIAPFCGSNLASSLVLLKAPNGVAFTATLFTDSDFDNTKGLTTTTGTKYLQTGFIPSAQGLTATNFTMAAVRMAFTKTNTSVFLSSIPTTGEGSPMIDFNTAAITRSNSTSAASEGQRAVVYTGRSGSWAGFSDGVQMELATASLTPTANTLQFEMTVFRGKLPDGNIYNSVGTIGFLAFGTSLTDAQAASLNKAMLQFTQDTRTWFVKRGVVFSVLGDSNGQAWQGNPTWANLLTTEYGWREFNHSQAGSWLNANASGTLSGLNRYLQVIDTNPEYGFIALGTNDALQDGQANGLSTTSAALTTNLNTICTAYKAKYIKPFILGVPWNSSINATKAALYTAAGASAAKTSGVPFVDLYNLFADQTTPGSFFTDGTHFGANGYAVVTNAIKERLQGRIFRTPTLDFPSIPAQSSADLPVTVYTAVAGMSVSLGLPAALEAGLVANAFVSANDTVTVRLTNTTAAAIDPASAQYKVTVQVGY